MGEEFIWTTWEELLLACAVNRHGLNDWDSVAMELQNRSSLPRLLTAHVCKNKYHDLKRRFMDHTDHQHDDEVDNIPWLEDLRKLRVAELKQEVHRYDLSIHSLQLKVKRLEEERERSLKEDKNDDGKPDLEKNLEDERSENDKDGAGVPDGEFSDRENRSFNESNSTENRLEEERTELQPIETSDVKPDPASSDSKPADEDSFDDSSDAAAKPSQENKGGESGDPAALRNSAAELKDSSDVQSSASLTRKGRRNTEVSGGGGDEPVVSPATIKREAMKSEPLVGLLDIIRSHKHGSMFERRLESQKTDEYKNMVRQHVDLETIRTRVNNGSYCSRTSKFYRDLLLLFNNAIVFFPKASLELVAAYELRDLVLEEMKEERVQTLDSSPEPAPSKPTDHLLQHKPDPERSESLLAKHRTSTPIVVVCRKRSSISVKASNSTSSNTREAEKQNPTPNPKTQPVKNCPNVKEKEESPTTKERPPVTGTRSLRRNSKGRSNSTPSKNSQTVTLTNPNVNNSSAADHKLGETLKTDKKKKTDMRAKKKGAADFLKRIKRTSPAKGMQLDTSTLKSRGGISDANNGSGRREQQQKKKNRVEGGKAAPVLKRSGGGGRKQVKEESSPSKRGVGRPPKKGRDAGGGTTKRGREGGGAEESSSKPANKRSKR